ncbi:MAG: LAGLIDADG family homing endonuclease [Parcubacteria group bacterium]
MAYIAGFLDGDGSLMIQIKTRNDSGCFRFMLTICFYQDSRHDKPLAWIRKIFGIGYLSKRNDNITELRINGYKQVERILKMLYPFVKFKKIQAGAIIKAAKLLQKKRMSRSDYEKLVDYIVLVQKENYVTKKKKTKEELLKVLGLTP